MHTGCESGWIDRAALVFPNKRVSGNYNGEMISKNDSMIHKCQIYQLTPYYN